MSTPYHKVKKPPQLLDWFNNDNYLDLYHLTDFEIYSLLERRSEIFNHLIRKGNLSEEYFEEVFKKFSFIKKNPLAKDSTLLSDLIESVAKEILEKRNTNQEVKHTEIVKIKEEDFDTNLAVKGASYKEPISGFGVDDDDTMFYTLANLFDEGKWISETKSYQEFMPEMLHEEFPNIVEVNLDAPESEIRESFNRWLKEAQNKRGSIKKPSFSVEKSSLINHRVLQYLDLWIYQEMEGQKYTRAELAEIIFGLDVKGISKLDDSTKPKALQVMSHQYLAWLKEVVSRPTDEEVEHGKKLREHLKNNGFSGDVIDPDRNL